MAYALFRLKKWKPSEYYDMGAGERLITRAFLKQELQRCQDIGTSILVLHPGSHVKAGEEVGLQQIIKGLNEVLFGIVSSADGETFSTNVNTTTVNTISANPNKVICPIIIAGIDTLKGYGQ